MLCCCRTTLARSASCAALRRRWAACLQRESTLQSPSLARLALLTGDLVLRVSLQVHCGLEFVMPGMPETGLKELVVEFKSRRRLSTALQRDAMRSYSMRCDGFAMRCHGMRCDGMLC